MDILKTLPWRTRSPLPVVGKGESLIMESRHHWMKRAPAFCVYVLLTAAGFAALLTFGNGSDSVSAYALLSILAALLAVQHWFFYMMLSESSTDIILTNKRILYFYHRLWLADEMDELVLKRIKLVKVYRKGLIRQVLDYGDLACLFDIDAGKTFLHIPAPGVWARHIESMIDIA